MSDDVSSRILTAATLAEKHGEELGRFTLLWPRQAGQTTLRHLMRASGPSHWGAVAELLRATARAHIDWHVCPDADRGVSTDFEADSDCGLDLCPTVAALLPLVDQIMRDLGDDNR